MSRTDQATSLKRKLTDLRAKADSGASFDATLQDIDKLIGSGDLVAAHRKIDALWKVTSDQSKQQMLDDRNQKIVASLKDLYDRGVQAYRDEDFKTAIDVLQTVVGVQVDYEQAGDYLDKARAKQKLVDQVLAHHEEEHVMNVTPRPKLALHITEAAYAVIVILWYVVPFLSPGIGSFDPRQLPGPSMALPRRRSARGYSSPPSPTSSRSSASGSSPRSF